MNALWQRVKNRLRWIKRRFLDPKPRLTAGTGGDASDIHGRITPQQLKKIKDLAKLRGDSFDTTLSHVLNFVGLKDVPGAIKPQFFPKNWRFSALDVEGAYHATITLENGRKLTGYRSDARFQRYYRCFCDLLPSGVTAETYEVYVESFRRYNNALPQFTRFLPLQGKGGTMVDAGAYIGFKALGYADWLGPGGRTLSIEIDPISESLARRNIEQNELQDRVQSFCCAVWSKDLEASLASSKGTQPFDRVRNSLVRIDEHPDWTVNRAVQTRSLDSIFRDASIEEVDYLNMQLNGAEIDALDGLNEYFDKTRVIYAAAGFHASGEALNTKVAAALAARGCWVKKSDEFVLAVTPRFRNHFNVA